MDGWSRGWRDSERMKDRQRERDELKMQEQKEEQDLLQIHIPKDTKSHQPHQSVCVQGICVDKEDCMWCAQTMMEWRTTTGIGVLFSRWQKK